MATTTGVAVLKINYLTQAQYDTALANNQINDNELYFISIDDSEGKGYLLLAGGNVTGPVNFGDSVTIDELTVGDLYVTGRAGFSNGELISYGTTALTPGTSDLGTGTIYLVYS